MPGGAYLAEIKGEVLGFDDAAVGQGTIREPAAANRKGSKIYVEGDGAREGHDSVLMFPVYLDPASTGTVTVNYATSDGTATADEDYTAVNDTLTFAPGNKLMYVRVPIIDDTVPDSGETLTLTLSSPVGADLADDGTATGTIWNSEATMLSVADAQGSEGDGTLDFEVTLNQASASEVTVSYTTQDGTATEGEDYEETSGTLRFAAGETQKTVSVAVIADDADEGEETLVLVLSDATGAGISNSLATGTIRDDGAVQTTGICGRTLAVRDAILAEIPSVTDCADVTDAHLGAITSLDLVDEGITSVHEEDFDGLSALEKLHLSDNELSSLPKGVFAGLSALEKLYLQGNQLTSLPQDVFAGLSALEGLHLYDNQLTALPTEVFDGLGALEELLLHGNQLTSLPEDVFDGLGALEYLLLYDNQLTALPEEVFDGLGALVGLFLQGNQLTALEEDLFDGLGALVSLYLQDNQLAALQAEVFDGLDALKDLYLSRNQLTALPESVFAPLDAGVELRLEGNPGAPFSPSAVALPDDGTVPVSGGAVTLDATSTGGAWGTNLSYRWVLTKPKSGVTVTFDDTSSATPEVTIPELAYGTELTFTLTATPRWALESHGIRRTTDTATVWAGAKVLALVSASVTGDALTLTFADALDESSVPPAGAFAVTVAGEARTVDEVTLAGARRC